jgi:hypothetical protein
MIFQDLSAIQMINKIYIYINNKAIFLILADMDILSELAKKNIQGILVL